MAHNESSLSTPETQNTREKLVGPFAVARQFSDYGSDTLRILDGNGQLKVGGINARYGDALETIIEAANKGMELARTTE